MNTYQSSEKKFEFLMYSQGKLIEVSHTLQQYHQDENRMDQKSKITVTPNGIPPTAPHNRTKTK